MEKFDFSGWATRSNLRCSDGRTIMKDAFKRDDGQTVPLVWNHQHNDPLNVLGQLSWKTETRACTPIAPSTRLNPGETLNFWSSMGTFRRCRFMPIS